MRQPTDLCLLCKVNLATKKNSHIYPKFLSKNFLGANRRGYDLGGDSILESKVKIIQDSPKENYILCDECENYFSILEGISSDSFINWKTKVEKGEFPSKSIIDHVEVVDFITSNIKTIRLFIYSIFWRVSISSHSLFENLKINPDFEDELRNVLLQFKSTKGTDYLNLLNSNPDLKIFPFSMLTAESFTDDTANILHAPFSYDPYCLVCDRYGFILFEKSEDIKIPFIKLTSNIKIDDCKLLVLPENSFYNAIVKKAHDLLIQQEIEKKV